MVGDYSNLGRLVENIIYLITFIKHLLCIKEYARHCNSEMDRIRLMVPHFFTPIRINKHTNKQTNKQFADHDV